MPGSKALKTDLLKSPVFSVSEGSAETGTDTGGSVKNSVAKDLPSSLKFTEETPGLIDLTQVKFNSLGSMKDVVSLKFTASSGSFDAVDGKDVKIEGAGTGKLTVTGKLADLMDYLGTGAVVSYEGAKDAFGTGSASLGLHVTTKKKSFSVGTMSVDLEDVVDDLIGTPDADTLTGEAGRNMILGLAGNDSLDGRGGDDSIHGEDGNDTISGGAGADEMDGGPGDDVLYYVGSAGGVTVDLAEDAGGKQSASGGDAQGDVISGFEHVYASEHADVLSGNAGRNILFGYGGVDMISGLAGDDVIQGGADGDILDGGDGLDWVRYLGSSAGVTVSLVAGVTGIGGDAEGDQLTGFENIQGSGHGDRLTGDSGDNYIMGFAGADYIDGGEGDDSIRGGEGADTMLGGAGIDTLQYVDHAEGVTIDLRIDASGYQSASGGDVISGFENVFGGAGGDWLTGDAGRNYLYGHAGNDTLAGREGKDVLKGYEGEDSFVFDTPLAASNVDRILDFEAGVDNLVLNSAIFAALGAGTLDAAAFLASDTATATTADHRLIYETGTGTLYYDPDGTGAAEAVAFAQLTSLPSITADDFLIV